MAFQKDKKYMKEHLKDYIIFQINQGYQPKDIKKLLIEHGYSTELVQEIFHEIGKLEAKTHPKKTKKEMSRDLYAYLQELLVDFILKERDQGYDFEAIRKALLNYGHNDDIVDSAIRTVRDGNGKVNFNELIPKKEEKPAPKKKHKKQKNEAKLPPAFLYSTIILAILCFAVYLTIATEASIFIVLVSFLPLIIAISANYFAILQFKSAHYMRLIPPLVVALTVLIFVGMLQYDSPLRNLGEPTVILVINAIGAFIFSSVLCFFAHWPHLGEKTTAIDTIQKEHVKENKDNKLEEDLMRGTEKLDDILGKEKAAKEKAAKEQKPQRLKIKDF